MPIFGAHLTDELLGPLPASFASVTATMTRLKELLAVDSYNDMGLAEQHREELFALEKQLENDLAIPLVSDFADGQQIRDIPVSVRRAWFAAFCHEWHYRDSVGDYSIPGEEILTTMPLATLPHFHVDRPAYQVYEQQRTALADALLLDTEEVAEILAEYQYNVQRLADVHRLFAFFRERVCCIGPTGTAELDRDHVFKLFTQLFPGHPLLPEDVDLVMTRTGLYWVLADAASFAPDRAEAKAWVKQHRRFRFEQFTHFPMFCNFDSRDADHDLLNEIATALDWDRYQVRFQLDRCMMLEPRSDIDKYLIHDSWGHVWQGYLSDLTEHYDHLATMQFPINADHHVVRLGNSSHQGDDIICLADCLYLRRDGTVDYDHGLADDYIHAVLNERMTALLTPICAELTADMIEYYFHADHEGSDIKLPSSSLFNHQPTKIDFAWADMQYFAKALARPIQQYLKDESLRTALVQRLAALLRLKYAHNAQQVDPAELSQRVDAYRQSVFRPLRTYSATAFKYRVHHGNSRWCGDDHGVCQIIC